MKIVIFNETKILDIQHEIKIYINNWEKKSELDKDKIRKRERIWERI